MHGVAADPGARARQVAVERDEVSPLADFDRSAIAESHQVGRVGRCGAKRGFDYLDGPVSRVAGPDVPGVPYSHVLEDWFMVNPEKIADGIRKLAAY